MTDKQKINPNDWLEPYKPIPACEIKDCDHLVYAGNDVYGCRIAEDGLVCDDFNNADECCMYRQLEYYKEALKAKEQERARWKSNFNGKVSAIEELLKQLDQLKAENKILKEKLEIAIKNNMDKTLLRLKNGDVQEELKEIREQFGIETLYFHDDNTRVHRCLDVIKLKNVLTEIKEIAEKGHKEKGNLMRTWWFKDILQKISECEGNDER